jgi:hypothetical protein
MSNLRGQAKLQGNQKAPSVDVIQYLCLYRFLRFGVLRLSHQLCLHQGQEMGNHLQLRAPGTTPQTREIIE